MLSQIIAVTGVNLRSIRQRLASSAVAIIGIAGVVVVFLGVLSIGEGFRRPWPMSAIRRPSWSCARGSDTEMTSGFGGETARLLMDTPGIARDASGPVASPELFVIVGHPSKKDPSDANVPLRGVSDGALKVRPGIKIVEGRMFTPGTNEIVVGRAASSQFAGLHVGAQTHWGQNAWQVVGIFDAQGSAAESEIWCDAKVLQGAYRRGNSYQSVYARLRTSRRLPGLQGRADDESAAVSHGGAGARVLRGAVGSADSIIRTVGFIVAGLMGIGASSGP